MVERGVEGVEVEPLGLGLPALGDLVAHPDENVRDPLGDRGDRVAGAGVAASGRQGDVDGFLAEHLLVPLGLQGGDAPQPRHGGEQLARRHHGRAVRRRRRVARRRACPGDGAAGGDEGDAWKRW